jgi:fucose permease
VAANLYLVVLGKPETASRCLDLAEAFTSLGTTVARKIGRLLIVAPAPVVVEERTSLSPAARHLYRVQEAAFTSVICYLYMLFYACILFYALSGSRPSSEGYAIT